MSYDPTTEYVYLVTKIAVPYNPEEERPQAAALDVLDDLRKMGYVVEYMGYHTAVPWGQAVGGRA